MEYFRSDNQICARLDVGDEISSSILAIAKKENISLASISGIGATDNADIGVFDMNTGTYDVHTYTGVHEITSLVGNLTTKDGEPYSHLHITLAGKDGSIVGGHLLRGVICLTAEIFITILNGHAERQLDSDLHINKITFPDFS